MTGTNRDGCWPSVSQSHYVPASWDRDKTGQVHNRTGTQRDRYATGLGHKWTGHIGTECVVWLLLAFYFIQLHFTRLNGKSEKVELVTDETSMY